MKSAGGLAQSRTLRVREIRCCRESHDSGFFPRDPAIPDARGDEDDAASGGEPDQKRHRQIKPRASRARCGKSAAQIRVERAGPRALQALLQNQFHRPVGAREGGRAMVGADHPLRRRRLGAIAAQRASAKDADRDGLGMVRGAFHGI